MGKPVVHSKKKSVLKLAEMFNHIVANGVQATFKHKDIVKDKNGKIYVVYKVIDYTKEPYRFSDHDKVFKGYVYEVYEVQNRNTDNQYLGYSNPLRENEIVELVASLIKTYPTGEPFKEASGLLIQAMRDVWDDGVFFDYSVSFKTGTYNPNL